MVDMTAAFRQSKTTFEQQAADLIHHRGSSHHPALTHSMHGLQIQLLFGLDRHEAHGRPLHGFGDGFGINVVALVRLYIGLDVLRRHQSDLVTLSAQSPPEEMGSAAGFHPDQLDAHVRGVRQQLRSRTSFANDDIPSRIEAHQVKHSLAQVNTNRL